MTQDTPRRAHSMEEFGAKMMAMAPSEEELAAAAPYELRPSDVMITPYGKCGTTMLQQMFHQLRTAKTDGDMDFDDISRVVPWFENSVSIGLDINAEQRANPRGFKSHLNYEALPAGVKYVVSLREPKAAFMSFFRFMEGWFIEPGTVTPEQFLPGWLAGGPQGQSYVSHLLSWWARRDEADTLLLEYADIVANKRAAIRKLAAFSGIALDDAALALVETRTSRAYMLEHKDRFDDALQRAVSESHAKLPPGSDSAKVRADGGSDREIPEGIAAQIDALWREQIMPVTGHADYAALAADLRG
jgi:hypothetical protein